MIKSRFLRQSALETLREAVPNHLDDYRIGSFGHLLVEAFIASWTSACIGLLVGKCPPDETEVLAVSTACRTAVVSHR
jgi:hypothetical protein